MLLGLCQVVITNRDRGENGGLGHRNTQRGNERRAECEKQEVKAECAMNADCQVECAHR